MAYLQVLQALFFGFFQDLQFSSWDRHEDFLKKPLPQSQ